MKKRVIEFFDIDDKDELLEESGRWNRQLIAENETLRARIAELEGELGQCISENNMLTERIAELEAAQAGRYDLKALQLCADAATTEAEDQRPLFDGEAINWGDLGCAFAEWCVDDEGGTYHRVWIEEVDPAAHHLRNFIRQYLTEHGYSDVQVFLEW